MRDVKTICGTWLSFSLQGHFHSPPMSMRCCLESSELHFPRRLLRKAPTSLLELLLFSPSRLGQEAMVQMGVTLPSETSHRAQRRDRHTGGSLLQLGKTFPSREALCVQKPVTTEQPTAAQPGLKLVASSLFAGALRRFSSSHVPRRSGPGMRRNETYVQAPGVCKSQGDFAAGKHFCQITPAAASKPVAVQGQGGGGWGRSSSWCDALRHMTATGSRWGNASDFGSGEPVEEKT